MSVLKSQVGCRMGLVKLGEIHNYNVYYLIKNLLSAVDCVHSLIYCRENNSRAEPSIQPLAS